MKGAPRVLDAPARPLPRGVPLVFLDFDNTLIDGDAGPLFGWYLFRERRHGLVGHPWRRLRLWMRYLPYLTWMGVQGVLYKVGAVRRSTIVRAAYRGLRGVHVDEMMGLLQAFAKESLVPRVYPAMAKEIRDHHAAGRKCVVITTGMEVLIRPVLDHVDAEVALVGCRLHVRGDRMTGHVDGPLFGQDKANILHAYCRALGVDPADAWAYTDHYSDKHMLEAVGHPVVVNPRGGLARLAHRRGWRILRPTRRDGPARNPPGA